MSQFDFSKKNQFNEKIEGIKYTSAGTDFFYMRPIFPLEQSCAIKTVLRGQSLECINTQKYVNNICTRAIISLGLGREYCRITHLSNKSRSTPSGQKCAVFNS